MGPRDGGGLTRKRSAAAVAGLVLWAWVTIVAPPARAEVTVVSGGAFGHWTKVSLFGGPSSAVGPLPDVRLPATGSDQPMTGQEAAGSAVYGPAHIFGGMWPPDVDLAPPSGPITVSTKGTTGARGTVTSSVDIVRRTPPDPKSPGGWGPLPPTQGAELHSTCTATETGVTGSTRFVDAVMSKSTTPDGEPLDEEPVPDNPPVNYTRTGVLTNVGDRYKIVYNEQFVEADGLSITVNAVHMYLLGDIAVGDQILGQVRCSVRGAPFPNTPPSVAPPATTAPPPTTLPPATPLPPATTPGGTAAASPAAAPAEVRSSSSSSSLPIAIGGGVVLVAAMGAGVAGTRRRRARRASPP